MADGKPPLPSSTVLATFEPSSFFLYFPMSYQLAPGNIDKHM
jgi:hypothetical protein